MLRDSKTIHKELWEVYLGLIINYIRRNRLNYLRMDACDSRVTCAINPWSYRDLEQISSLIELRFDSNMSKHPWISILSSITIHNRFQRKCSNGQQQFGSGTLRQGHCLENLLRATMIPWTRSHFPRWQVLSIWIGWQDSSNLGYCIKHAHWKTTQGPWWSCELSCIFSRRKAPIGTTKVHSIMKYVTLYIKDT